MMGFEITGPSHPGDHCRSHDGTILPLRFSQADGLARAVVHINHGLAEHSGRYSRFAQALSKSGFHVYAHDHRGHGANIGKIHPKGMFAPKGGYASVLSDVHVVNQHIHSSHPDLPVIIFGHSMGGLIALNYVQNHAETVNAAAIWNANFAGGLENRLAVALLYLERMLKGSDVPSALLPKLTFRSWGRSIPNHKTLFDWLSHDAAEVERYISDPLCGFDPTVSMWLDVFRFMANGTTPQAYGSVPKNLPFHLVGGAQDPATDHGRAVQKLAKILRTMDFINVTENIWPQNRHECLNEIDRDLVTQNFIDWLKISY